MSLISYGNAMNSSAVSKRRQEERKLKYEERKEAAWQQGQKRLSDIVNSNPELSDLIENLRNGLKSGKNVDDLVEMFPEELVDQFDSICSNDKNSNYFESQLMFLYKDLQSKYPSDLKIPHARRVVENLYSSYDKRKK